MEPEPRQRQVRRIVLPSGRKIDVIGVPERSHPDEVGLHVCPACGSHLVQPHSWQEESGGRWQLDLHCPSCDWEGSGVYGPELIEHYEDTLEAGVQAVLDDLRRLTYANMAAEVDRFVDALEADLILPEDF